MRLTLCASLARLSCLVAGVLGGALPLGTAWAATFPNLYQVTVTPEPGAVLQRADAERLAMQQLLVRVTGKREAAFDAALAPLLMQPATYVNQYGRDPQGRPLVGFAASRVDEALNALSWPVWPAERPLTLLWIAVDNGLGERALLGANEMAALSPEMSMLVTALKDEADAVALERGLPLAFPLLDLEDLTAVTPTDVLGFFEDPIQRASGRYRPDAILIGRVRPGLYGNEVQCLHLRHGVRRSTSGAALRDCLDTVGDLYAAEYSVVGGASTMRISVVDVGSLGDYGRVVSYLESLSVLQSVDVESFDAGVLTLRIAGRGDSQVLERQLSLGGVLQPVASSPVVGPATGPAGGLVFTVARPNR